MVNPYQTGTHAGEAPPPAEGGSGSLAQVLAATVFWQGACIAGALLMAALLAFIGLVAGIGAVLGAMGASPGIILLGAAFYLLGAVFCILPAVRLWKCCRAIGNFTRTGAGEDLLRVMEHHRKFWRYVAIMLLLLLVFAGSMSLVGLTS